jgi:Fe2+ transport system protein FeoA
MLTRWLRRTTTSPRTAPELVSLSRTPAAVDATAREVCATTCPLAQCARGNCAVVVRVDCSAGDACRLRSLGVYEGARVDVVDSRNGLLLQVRGSRIALGATVAAAIAVIPVS